MKISPAWLKSDVLQFILGELSFGGGEAYCVGGCVRDAVMGLPVNDIDIATSRTPAQVEAIFSDWEGSHAIKLLPTGVAHGTWTIVMDGESFEVTSYRNDVTTDGRRATVAFTTSMADDADRRDFTMNALYMDWAGNVEDPTGKGLHDIMSRTVRFVGDAGERCKEDYLRIMRLFRFHAKYGKGPMNESALLAAKFCANGLKEVSGERIWVELKKLLACHDPSDALRQMELSGVLSTILPHASDTYHVSDVIFVEQETVEPLSWERRLVALMGYDEDDVQMPFPISNQEQNYLTCLAQNSSRARTPAHVAFRLKDTGAAMDCCILKAAFDRAVWVDPTAGIIRGMQARLPVSAQDFMDAGVEQGPDLGACLKLATKLFIASDLTASKEHLMERVASRMRITLR